MIGLCSGVEAVFTATLKFSTWSSLANVMTDHRFRSSVLKMNVMHIVQVSATNVAEGGKVGGQPVSEP